MKLCRVPLTVVCPSVVVRSEFGDVVIISFLRAGRKKNGAKARFFTKDVLSVRGQVAGHHQDTSHSFSSVVLTALEVGFFSVTNS